MDSKSWFRDLSHSRKSSPALPRWRNPPLPPSLGVPPPIVSSVILPMRSVSSSRHTNPRMPSLERRERYLQSELQTLLDAQGDGLIAGLGALPDDQTSNGSSTPRGSAVIPMRQPRQKRISLRAARRGIYDAIEDLANVKNEESLQLSATISRESGVLEQIQLWERKRDGLNEATKTIREGEEAQRTEGIRQEADALQQAINRMEEQLSAMKARQRKLLRDMESVENNVQAKLSSYTTSLKMLDTEVRNFLTRPQDQYISVATGTVHGGETFWALPPDRRSLALAKEHWSEEVARLRLKQEAVDTEKEALEEGAVVWRDVVHEVTDFEKRLQDQMEGMALISADGESHKEEDEDPATATSSLLSQMDQTILQIESKLKLAETRNWRLLICCIGAELEAFRQGKLVLEDALGASREPDTGHEHDLNGLNSSSASESDGSEIHRLDEAFGSSPKTGGAGYDTDDEPDPELLISHQDTDTE
ncbi:hypothetical protein LTR66_004958 [Elasticomyces elasticus]|nr:hypothetical protein LTR66_004958 [Elasticomyces elasticus]